VCDFCEIFVNGFSDIDITFTNPSPAVLRLSYQIAVRYSKWFGRFASSSSRIHRLNWCCSIGDFKGGQELFPHTSLWFELFLGLAFGDSHFRFSAFYTLFLCYEEKLNAAKLSAIAAAYGSISCVTFVAAVGPFWICKVFHLGQHGRSQWPLRKAPAIIQELILLQNIQ